jgi:hypothetical protein
MRIILVTLCTLAVVTVMPAPAAAQTLPGPILQVSGQATPGSLIAIDVGQATPGALAVLAFGFSTTPTPIGAYGTLDIALFGILVLGTVRADGMIFSAMQVPASVPPELHGTVVYSQGAIIRLQTGIAGPEVAVDLTNPQSTVLEVSPPDPDPMGNDAR